MNDKTNVVVGNFGRISDVEKAFQEAQEWDLEDVIIIGFREGKPAFFFTDMQKVNPFSAVGSLDVAKDILKMDVLEADEESL